VRVTYSGPRILRYAIPATLSAWILLSTYLVLYTAPPLVCGILLAAPVLLLFWVSSLMTRGIVWEMDSIGYSCTRGGHVAEQVRWEEVRTLSATGAPQWSTAWMAIVDVTGKTRMKLVASYALSVEDLRTLYEAAAYYLRDVGVAATNNMGWRPNLPTSGSLAAIGERPRLLPYIAESLLVSGVLILITGSLEGGVSAPASFGVGLIAIALAVLTVMKVRFRKPMDRIGEGPN